MKTKHILGLAVAIAVTFSFTLLGLTEKRAQPEAVKVKSETVDSEPVSGFFAEDKF